MNIRKMQKLEKLGYDKEWLLDVKQHFHPKKRGKYRIKIYDIVDLSQEPDEGIWLDTTCFSTELGLSFVHYFFEGNAYIMYETETNDEIGRGIIDSCMFDEVDETWEWLGRKEMKKIIDKQQAVEDAKPKEYIRRPRKLSKYESLAKDIYKWCKKKRLWGDNIIYFDGKAWSSSHEWNGEKGKKVAEDLYEYAERDPREYFGFANPDTLSMSFEGGLYNVLNGYVRGWSELEVEFEGIFARHGCYYELGHAWNLSAYEN